MVNPKMTYERLVDECKRLRLKSERAEAEFFAFLMIAEREHAEVWQGGGCETFDQFLRSNHLVMDERYRLFAIGVDRSGLDAALANGAHWTIQAGRMREPNKKALDAFAEQARAFIELEKTSPSEQTVRQWAAELTGNVRGQKIDQVSELHRLRAENQELRAKLKMAEKRVAMLEAKMAKKGGRPEARA